MRTVVALGLWFGLALPSMAAVGCHDAHGSYVNSSVHVVPDPKCVTGHQPGETAICRDGSHSFSEHRQGTCSRHGGVAQWE